MSLPVTLFCIYAACAVVCVTLQRVLGLTETKDNHNEPQAHE